MANYFFPTAAVGYYGKDICITEVGERTYWFHWFEFIVNELARKVLKPKVTVAYLKTRWETRPINSNEREDVYTTDEYYGRVGDEFNFCTSDKFDESWWINNYSNPTVLVYNGEYFLYGENGYHKRALFEFPKIASIDEAEDIPLLNNNLQAFFKKCLIENNNPVDYLYNLFINVKK